MGAGFPDVWADTFVYIAAVSINIIHFVFFMTYIINRIT